MTDISIDVRYLTENQPSICIPRVFHNITEQKIQEVFNKVNYGQISRIDIVKRINGRGEKFNIVYIHFHKWYWNRQAQDARHKLLSNEEINIVYDDPWYWKVVANKYTDYTKQEHSRTNPRQRDNRTTQTNSFIEKTKPKYMIDNPDEITHLFANKIDYGDVKWPTKKRTQKKNEDAVVANKSVESDNYANMSDEDKQFCDELYGDL